VEPRRALHEGPDLERLSAELLIGTARRRVCPRLVPKLIRVETQGFFTC
jgi:hypothetical protein